MLRTLLFASLLAVLCRPVSAQLPAAKLPSPFVAIDLNLGEMQEVTPTIRTTRGSGFFVLYDKVSSSIGYRGAR